MKKKEKIKCIGDLSYFIESNSNFSYLTVNNVFKALGFPVVGAGEVFIELTKQLQKCAEHGADSGFPGFILYTETVPFFKKNRHDIVNHMEQTAADMGTDIITMVQDFGVFRKSEKPTPSQVGKALYDSRIWPELYTLYNVFAWYALEEVSRTWYRYLEDNPAVRAELAA